MAARPLWDRLGGEAAVKAVVHDFVVLAAADPKVDFFRVASTRSTPRGWRTWSGGWSS